MSDEQQLNYLRIEQLNYLKEEIEDLGKAIYGDSREKINGGGLYGELRRFRVEMTQLSDQRDQRLRTVEEQVRQLLHRQRPVWWDYIIVGGGLFMLVVASLQVALFVLLYQVLR